MISKKGFTLIETMVSIAIISIIAVITVPIIGNVIKDINERAFKTGVDAIIRTVRLDVKNNVGQTTYYRVENGQVSRYGEALKIKGTVEGTGYLIVDENGEVSLNINYDNKCALKDFSNTDVTISTTSCTTTISAGTPVVTLIGNNNIEHRVGRPYTDLGVLAMDNTDGNITDKVTLVGEVNSNVTGTYTLTYNIKNSLGNTASITRTVKVIDTLPPVITITGNNPLTYEASVSYVDPGATAVDEYEGDISSKIKMTSTVVPGIVGNYKVTYNIMDLSGNVISAERIVNVVDTSKPTVAFNLNGNNTYKASHSTVVNVIDNGELNLNSLEYQWTNSINTPTEASFSLPFTNGATIASTPGVSGSYYLWILAKDTAGNTMISNSNAFNLDNAAPSVAFGTNGNETYSKTYSSTVTISDTGSGVNTSSLEYQWTNSTNAPTEASFTQTFNNGSTVTTPSNLNGGYYLWILAKDNGGSTTITRSNIFNLDNTNPTIAFGTNGNSTYAKSYSSTVTADATGSTFSTLKYLWSTSSTSPGESTINTSGTTFTSGISIPSPVGVTGGYYLWVLAKDIATNTLISGTAVFNLDNTAPVITMVGNNPMYIPLSASYADAGASATDNITSNPSITYTSTINSSIVGNYTFTYTATDGVGNVSTAVRNVTVATETFTYSYTGSSQTFTAPATGRYIFELWGSGAATNVHAATIGKGGYVYGEIDLNKDTVFYVYVGGQNAYNGGGSGETVGGGATDIRLSSGAWNDTTGLRSRIMVAGGGGAGVYSGCGYAGNQPGHAGGLTGQSAYFDPCGYGYGYSGYGASQTAGGAGGKAGYVTGVAGGFGYGGGTTASSGGGGGYYGGGSGTHPGSTWSAGGGGSSFISGHTGSNAVNSSGVHTGTPNHYSGYLFTKTSMIGGNAEMPATSGGYEVGHAGNGYARIRYLGMNPFSVEILVVAGGGGGGGGEANPAGDAPGGGGAGGYIYRTNFTIASQTYIVNVGNGGAGATGSRLNGTAGGNSAFSSLTAIGGGYGGKEEGPGGAGGAGGGGGGACTSGDKAGGAGTLNQGWQGGTGIDGSCSYRGGAGGGGIGGPGANNLSNGGGGAGGAGTTNSITGTSKYYAGGGGGGAGRNVGALGGAGGSGIGGSGGSSPNGAGGAAAANTGSGGGGAGSGTNVGGAGSAGIVIIAYPGTVAKATGGTISTTSRPGYVVHTFTSNGTLTVASN